MGLLGIVNRWLLLLGLPLLRRIPFVRDLPLVRGYFWIRCIDLPAADRARLTSAVNAGTAAFIGPNHPEFGTDWLVDKELSTMVAPVMASWADSGIVAAAPRFWGMNNLIANDGGEVAKDYSVQQAIAGAGVLLHPEGTVRWTNDVVHPLFPGIAQMAIKAAATTDKPVFIVPVVWKYCYVSDVSARTHREMGIIERALGLPNERGLSVPLRFGALQVNLLADRMKHFGYEEPVGARGFFERQAAFQQFLVDALEQRHAAEHSPDVDKRVARLARAIRSKVSEARRDAASGNTEYRAALKHDLAIAEEAKRLGECTRAVYGTPLLTQEQVYECLKRIRDRLMRQGWRNVLANILPMPFGPRVVHVRVPEPLAVTRDGVTSGASYEATLLKMARARMQQSIDAINARIAPEVQRRAHENPLIAPR
ncbi:hypothetical protein BH11GEM1_BH11GEM1_31090 [soil metagenome]